MTIKTTLQETSNNHNRNTVNYMYNKNQILNNTLKNIKNKNVTTTINNIKYTSKNKREQDRQKDLQYNKNLILVDTGSPIHITNKKNWLKNYHTIKNAPRYGGIGSKEDLNIVGSGFLPIKANKKNVVLVQTYYVPQEQITILSASKLYEETKISLLKGYNTLETSEGKKINTLIKKDSVWVKAEDIIDMPKGKVYHIRPENPIIHKPTMELEEAHIRLNHIPKRIITEGVKKNIYEDVSDIKDANEEEDWCPTCISGKMTRHFHHKNSMNYYNKNKLPGESWSIDIFGPINGLPVNQDRYMLLMVDNVSKYIMVTTHSHKDAEEIKVQILHNIKFVETQFDRKVKQIISDKGTEFTNAALKEALKELGIQLILTPTQDHSSNARAERNIRTIITDARTMLLQSRMQLKFWKYAVHAAADIRNCSLNRTINEAPLRIISKIKPVIQLRSFLPFGAPALLWEPIKSKLKPPTIQGLVLCKDKNGFGYWFYIPKTRKIISTTNYYMPSFTTNHSSYISRNYETIIDLYNKELEKKIGENKDTDFAVDEIIDNLNTIDQSMNNNDETEDEEGFDPTDIQNMPLDKFLSETTEVETIENIDELTTTNLHECFSDKHDDKFKDDRRENDKLNENDYVQYELRGHQPDGNENNNTDEENTNRFVELLDSESMIEENIDEQIIENEVNKAKEFGIKMAEKVNNNKNCGKNNGETLNSEKPTSDSNKETTILNTDLRREPDNIDEDDINFYEEKHGDQEPDVAIINDDDNMDITANNHEVQPPLNYRVKHKNGKHLRSGTFLNKKKRNIKQMINKKISDYIDQQSTDEKKHTHIDIKSQEKENFKEQDKKHDEKDDKIETLEETVNNKEEKYMDIPDDINKVDDVNSINVTTEDKQFYKERPVTKRQHEQDNETTDVQNIGLDNNRKYITKGPKKFRINFIYPKESSTKKIHALYFKQAITNNTNVEEKKKYLEAYKKELNNLKEMGVFDPKIKIARNSVKKEKIIPINTIFTCKRNGVYKARIVCRGDLQNENSYNQIETSILDMQSLKILLTVANNKKMFLRTFDINHAFLYADLNEELYIPHPQNNKIVTPLKKSLYGLKQSPYNWNNTLKQFMNSIGLHDSIYSPGLYVSEDESIMIAAYVDDCIIAAEQEDKLEQYMKILKNKFALKELGFMINNQLKTDILGLDLNYDRTEGIIQLNIKNYIEKMFEDYKEIISRKEKINSVPNIYKYTINPKTDTLIMNKSTLKAKIKWLQVLIGKLNYIRTRGRLDIEFALGKLSRLVLFPHPKVIRAAKKLLKYVYDTRDIGITLKRDDKNSLDITVITDASLGSEFDLKSRLGVIIWIGNNFYDGFSKKSTIVCRSSAEAELDALTMGEDQAVLLKCKIKGIFKNSNPRINIITDSKPAIDWLKQDYFKTRTKFIGLRLEKLKEEINEKSINIFKIKGEHNLADPLTKETTWINFSNLIDILKNNIKPDDVLSMTE